MNPKILATATVQPQLEENLPQALAYAEQWLEGQDDRLKRKALRIFRYAQVERRYSVTPPENMIRNESLQTRNDRYVHHAIELSEKALRDALDRAQLNARDLDMIITVSCTGFMIPSLDAYLINRLHMRQDTLRLPVTEMGCAAGVSALIYAKQLLQANPGKRAAIIAAEFPSCTFQAGDYSMTNIVSTAIFGDGVACAILGFDEDKPGPSLGAHGMYHFYDAIDMMGYRVNNDGFQMVLDPAVPETIETHFPDILPGFLSEYDLTLDDIDHFVFHPGGKKIVQLVEEMLHAHGKNIDATKAILRDYGNMSSATVLYVLHQIEQQGVKPGDRGLMLSFGPGFSAQRILLHWS